MLMTRRSRRAVRAPGSGCCRMPTAGGSGIATACALMDRSSERKLKRRPRAGTARVARSGGGKQVICTGVKLRQKSPLAPLLFSRQRHLLKLAGDACEHVGPVAVTRLPEEAHGGIPGAIGPVQKPAPVRSE